MLKIFNTASRQIEEFVPTKANLVTMYCCGPTVYNYAHLGNLRTYLLEDLLRRVLQFEGFQVKHVTNITDVGHLTSDADTGEDKVEKKAKDSGMSAYQLTAFYTEAFIEDLDQLNILRPSLMPLATDHIQDQIDLILALEKKGFTYRTDDGIYFDISKFAYYGKLSGQKMEEKKAGARLELNTKKKHPADFALWKFSPANEKRQMEWPSPWSEKGFPGWHIECSAMSMKYLGETIDIHCGGVDHIAVHHEDEIAQSEAVTEKQFVKYWVHGEFMTIEGKRMGKSEGNAFLISDLREKNIHPLAFRLLNFSTHYRIQLNFTWESLQGAQKSLQKLHTHLAKIREAGVGKIHQETINKFKKFIESDLNLAGAISVLWEIIKSEIAAADQYATILEMDKILGLKCDINIFETELEDIPPEVEDLVAQRNQAKQAKNYQLADQIRDQINSKGYLIIDQSGGTKVIKK